MILPASVPSRPIGNATVEALTQQRQHVGAELRDEAALVVPRGVDDQVLEPEVDVGLDPRGHVLRVVRHDEARVARW